MQTTRFTREELHRTVWAESRLSLAKKLGVSDVWIRKACVAANVPVPPPGYWAMSDEKQSTHRRSLPDRAPGQSDEIVFGADRYQYGYQEADETPAGPVFARSQEDVRLVAMVMVAGVSPSRGLDGADRAIVKLLAEDEVRRAEFASQTYSWKKPLFVENAARRRLRIINGLVAMLSRRGRCTLQVDRHNLDFSLVVWDTSIRLWLFAKGKRPDDRDRDRRLELADNSSETLVLEVRGDYELAGLRSTWEDGADGKLEDQLREICVELIVRAEMSYRAGVVRHREWQIERKKEREARESEARAAALRAERERLAALEKARVDHLMALAEHLRRADEIRSLVAAMQLREAAETLGDWSTWALGVADRLDPLKAPFSEISKRSK